MTVPFPPGKKGDDEEVPDSTDEGQELSPGEQVTAEDQLPSEAQGEVNGGPLGCCLGVTIGLLLSLIVAVLSRLYADPLTQVFHGSLSMTVRIVMSILAIAGAVLFGYVGWKIGKRLYREYELSPRQQRKLAHLEQRQLQRQARRR
jgi:energy-converting hydrogenase Eha subunit B